MAINMVRCIKTTLVIEDSVFRRVKEQAAASDTTISALVTQSLRFYLESLGSRSQGAPPFSMPVFKAKDKDPSDLSPARLAELRDDGR